MRVQAGHTQRRRGAERTSRVIRVVCCRNLVSRRLLSEGMARGRWRGESGAREQGGAGCERGEGGEEHGRSSVYGYTRLYRPSRRPSVQRASERGSGRRRRGKSAKSGDLCDDVWTVLAPGRASQKSYRLCFWCTGNAGRGGIQKDEWRGQTHAFARRTRAVGVWTEASSRTGYRFEGKEREEGVRGASQREEICDDAGADWSGTGSDRASSSAAMRALSNRVVLPFLACVLRCCARLSQRLLEASSLVSVASSWRGDRRQLTRTTACNRESRT